MSPEQIASHDIPLDRRTDVYSLGVTLFECLTLQRPFNAPTREGLYQAILTRPTLNPQTLNRALPADLKVVLETALEKDRQRRYATALDFAEDLRRVRCFEPIKARPAGPLTKIYRWTQRNPALAAALIGLFAVLAAGLTASLYFLDQATGERNAKAVALDAAAAALADYDRHGDVSRLTRLIAEADAFWPAEPTKLGAMRSWLDEARKLEQNLPGHRAVRDALRASADVMPWTDADTGRTTGGAGEAGRGVGDPRRAPEVTADVAVRDGSGTISARHDWKAGGRSGDVCGRRGSDSDAAAGKPLPENVDPLAGSHESPVRAVTLAPFFLSKYELTQGQWQRITGRNPARYKPRARVGDQTTALPSPVDT